MWLPTFSFINIYIALISSSWNTGDFDIYTNRNNFFPQGIPDKNSLALKAVLWTGEGRIKLDIFCSFLSWCQKKMTLGPVLKKVEVHDHKTGNKKILRDPLPGWLSCSTGTPTPWRNSIFTSGWQGTFWCSPIFLMMAVTASLLRHPWETYQQRSTN